ncbi:MAG TPA: hypothetical protein VFA79_21250, partial [Myxococcales bacterium]|nr:hypothetical protein [Myxococcales bacterium]
ASARVRAIAGGVVDTLAGGRSGGSADGFGADVSFGFPRAVAVAPDRSLLVVDAERHALLRITSVP